jgi:hypothetical protein
MNRRVVLLATILMSVQSLAPLDDYTLVAVNLLAGCLMCYGLGTLFIQSKKIHMLVEPYLKISLNGAEEKMRPSVTEGATAPIYGSAGEHKV